MTTITPELEQLIINDYLNSELKSEEIQNKYEISSYIFLNIRKKHDIPFRKAKYNTISINQNYFETINTPAKAYYLGFIAGDGYLRYRAEKNCHVLRIELNSKDIDILEKFKQELESEHTINLTKRFDKKYNIWREPCSIEISNTKLCTDIIKNGVGLNKSKELKLPNINDNLMRHYVRGLIDSDGGWHIRSTGKNEIIFSFVSSVKQFSYDVMNFLMEKCSLDEVKVNVQGGGTSYVFYYAGNVQTKRIYQYLYGDGGPWLDRKYNLTTEFFKNTIIKFPNMKEIKEQKKQERLLTGEIVKPRKKKQKIEPKEINPIAALYLLNKNNKSKVIN